MKTTIEIDWDKELKGMEWEVEERMSFIKVSTMILKMNLLIEVRNTILRFDKVTKYGK